MEEIYKKDNKIEIKLSRKDLAQMLNGKILETYRGNKIGMYEE